MTTMAKIVLIAIFGAAALGGGWYVMNSDNDTGEGAEVRTQDEGDTEAESDTLTESATEVEEEQNNPRSLRALMHGGKSVQCDYNYESEVGGVVAGTVFVDEARIRGDFDMEQNGAVYESHMIIKDNIMHTWTFSPQGTHGVQFEIPEEGAASNDGAVSLDQELTYTCIDWRVDESKFVIPTDIEFRDMTAFMKPATSPTTGGSTANQCGLCDLVTEADAKAECKAALKCS